MSPKSLSEAPLPREDEKAQPIASGTVKPLPKKIIYPLHGIRTYGVWQKVLSDLVGRHDLVCRLERWSYGRFGILPFLTTRTREAKLGWFREQYDAEINDRRLKVEAGLLPSVVAHSFGTYILGYALLRFDFIRFDKVILCGSILPVDFPWDKLIERGQVQAVRNEYGARDLWVKCVCWFVRGTGPSGAYEFTREHKRLEQRKFDYDHSEYFGKDHIEHHWIPFLSTTLEEIPSSKGMSSIPRPPTSKPWGLYGLVLITALAIVAVLIGLVWGRWQRAPKGDRPHATRPAEAGTMLSRIPSVEDLTSIAAALQELLLAISPSGAQREDHFSSGPSPTARRATPSATPARRSCSSVSPLRRTTSSKSRGSPFPSNRSSHETRPADRISQLRGPTSSTWPPTGIAAARPPAERNSIGASAPGRTSRNSHSQWG